MDKPQGQFLFLMRGADWGGGLTSTEIATSLESMFAWIEEMKAKGVLLAGEPLDSSGLTVGEVDGKMVDGPFVESKEAVGGYLLVQVSSFQEAVDWARQCPVLRHGLRIEVRPLASACHLAEDVGVPMPDVSSVP